LSNSKHPFRLAVIGGGISGLAAAHRIVELYPQAELTLFESSHRLGGALHTYRTQGYLIERGADSFITNVPWASDLCDRVGCSDQLLATSPHHRGVYVVRRGKLVKLPDGFQMLAPSKMWPVLTSNALSCCSKLRLLCEPFVPRHTGPEESLEEFATRRLGRKTFEQLVEPLAAGIYTGDARKLSAAATMPQFVEMEKTWGSLSRGMKKRPNEYRDNTSSGARYSLFVTLRDGMQNLATAIADRLPQQSVRLGTPVRRIQRQADGCWKIEHDASETGESFMGVILAVGAPQAALMVESTTTPLSQELQKVEVASAVSVALGYRREQFRRPLDCFGLVVPRVERRRILAASFPSIKYPDRAPDNCVLIRVFLGGVLQPSWADQDDDVLTKVAREELAELLHIQGPPVLQDIVRWHGSMPQYHVGHLATVGRIEQYLQQLPGLQLAGNAYHGVGIPAAIHSGEQAAEKLLHDDLSQHD
jgi:oxygen-dependent protoporphyrinogen oxidase